MVSSTMLFSPLLLLSVLCFLSSLMAVHGATTAPSPAVDCSNEILNLADCTTYVQQGSQVNKPEGNCCSGLKKVVKENISCLCQAFKSSADFGVVLNTTKALNLPRACGVSTPPVSKCNIAVAGVPTAAPASSPGVSSVTPLSGGGHISTTPAPSPSHSNAAVISVDLFVSVAVAMLFFSLQLY